jgi:hypothetical protein
MLVLSPDSGFVLAPCDGAYIANEFKKELVVDSRGSWNAVRAASFIWRGGVVDPMMKCFCSLDVFAPCRSTEVIMAQSK